MAQFTLVVVGCFEPTPFADLTNALLSMTALTGVKRC